ncbi:hypothetical protein Vretimale_14095 [Volvox reticuliferus]|uniref:Uncharacterized protein n=1 Tax=Volvox reticuliferus TaxID=1737510 RepID=A0A8J4GMX2_9CHLO|nr:hypothetical protein Vretifemale_16256 [Volvox reticuliferus]GIM10327.1 hypothetical protein Vretimale_14095 [Volvox reticuliferus]
MGFRQGIATRHKGAVFLPTRCVRRCAAFTCSLWSSRGNSERERKDPANWRSIEDLRLYLERPQGLPGGFSSLLTWISQNAFVAGTDPIGIAALYRSLLRMTPTPAARRSAGHRSDRVDVTTEVLERAQGSPLSGILLISPNVLAAMATEVPSLLAMSADEAVGRLTGLKMLLPSCDISHLVATEPRLYLEAPREEVEEQLCRSLMLLDKFSMPNSLVEAMITQDPALPWVVTERGLVELRKLWPPDLVDTQALLDSDPCELALALRAMSTRLQ